MAYDCLKRLYKEELYSNVAYLGNLLMTTMDRRPDFMSTMNRYQACVYYADALSHLSQYRRAESVYMKALSVRKTILSGSNKSPAAETRKSLNEYTSETEVKYRLHLCLTKQCKFKESVGLLESIPVKQRNAKIIDALADLYKRLNLVQAAAQQYNELLKSCPYSVEAIVELLNFGVTVDEIKNTASACNVDLADTLGSDWFTTWLNGQSSLARRDYPNAVSSFKDLDTKTTLANNPNILCSLAMSYYFAGEQNLACQTLQRVHTLDKMYIDCMDVLASLLAEEKNRQKELETLATDLIQISPDAKQSWVAMGYLCRSLKKFPKALYFAHKACGDGKQQSYVEGMLLKGVVLMDMKKFNEASLHFHEALQSNPFRYELYEGLINCHLERNKTKEARAAAALCLKQMGQTARSLTLYATVLSKDASTLNEAQNLLERAVASAPYLMNAICLLVSIYDRQKQYDKAVDLLKRQTSFCVNSRLHLMLGDLLSKSTHYAQAMDSYRFALSLDPSEEPSISGVNELCAVGTSTQSSRVWDSLNRSLTGNLSNATNTTNTLANGQQPGASSSSTVQQTPVGTVTTPEVVITSATIQAHPPNAPARHVRPSVVDRSTAISTPNFAASTSSAADFTTSSSFMETDVAATDMTME